MEPTADHPDSGYMDARDGGEASTRIKNYLYVYTFLFQRELSVE